MDIDILYIDILDKFSAGSAVSESASAAAVIAAERS